MANISPGLALVALILLLIVLLTRPGRLLAGIVLVAGVLYAATIVFTRSYACDASSGQSCLLEMQPTWAGPCRSSENSGVLSMQGMQVLSAPPGVSAHATCLTLRVWQ